MVGFGRSPWGSPGFLGPTKDRKAPPGCLVLPGNRIFCPPGLVTKGALPSGPLGPVPQNFGGGFGGFGLFGYGPSPTPTPTSESEPVDTSCRDNLSDPGFDVPFSTTVNVSGGGAALQNAVNAAGPNTRLLITDSAVYDPVLINGKTNLTIEGQAGQTPIIRRPPPSSFPSTVPGWALRLSGVCDGIGIKNIRFEGHGNQNSLSFADNGLINCRPDVGGEAIVTLNHMIVEDCLFQEMSDSPINGNAAIALYAGGTGVGSSNIVVRRCIMDTNGAGSWATGNNVGAVTIAGFGDVWIQNSWIRRTDSLVARAASHMRGVCVKNLNTRIEDVLVDDIGTAGSNENFNQPVGGTVQFGTAVGPTTVRNCVAYNAKRGYRQQVAGATMTVTTSVYHTDTPGILAGQVAVRQSAGTMVFRNNVMVGAGDGTAFEAAVTEDHNDVFNFGATGKVLDPTDLTIDPVFQDVPNNIWVATAPALQTAGSDAGPLGVRYPGGEAIIWCGA